MDQMLIIEFDNMLNAYEGARSLQDLHDEGSLILLAKAVVARDASGKSVVKIYDLAHLKISQELLAEVERSLQPGKAAVVAEVWEESTLPVDARMVKLDGVVYRRSREELLDAHIKAIQMESEAKINSLQEQADRARDGRKARLEVQIAKLQADQKRCNDKLKQSLEITKEDLTD